MGKCTCGDSHAAPADEEVVEAEKSEALDEPIAELDKHEELYKDMEQTLGKLKEVMAYLEEMAAGEEKAEEEEEEEEEEEAPEEEEKAEEEMEEEEEEEEEAEDEEKSVARKAEDLHKSLKTLKKYGINVYSGRRKTPAPKLDTPAVNEKTDWFNFSKSLDEVAYMKGEETKI
jgi:DNA repair exonuclease SbcCD ATPase subunit